MDVGVILFGMMDGAAGTHGSVFLSPHNDYAVTEYHGRSYQLASEKENLKHCPTLHYIVDYCIIDPTTHMHPFLFLSVQIFL